jgi:vacuolar-type H+-ATPase subunit D/Vma8
MEKTNMVRRMEELLKSEREQLLSEVREAILRKKAMMADLEEYYKKQRF